MRYQEARETQQTLSGGVALVSGSRLPNSRTSRRRSPTPPTLMASLLPSSRSSAVDWSLSGFSQGCVYFGYCRLFRRMLILSCQGTWKCVGLESGTVFSEVDMDEGEWVDYDEKVMLISHHELKLWLTPVL